MKKYIFLIISFISFFTFLSFHSALSGYTTGTYVSIRTGAGTNYDKIVQLPDRNTPLDIVSETLYNVGDASCPIGWYQVNYNGSIGYVCGTYVTIGEITPSSSQYNTANYEARIYGTGIQVRSSASGGSAIKTRLLPGTNVVVKSDKIPGSGCAEGWYQISYYKDDTGYVCSSYIRTKSELTASDANYENELRSKGFPNEYIPYLVKLHLMHPTWVFNPIQTGLSWEQVVGEEANSNYIEGFYLDNTNRDVYSKGASPEKNWYYATNGVNAFYLDPRNFLSEKFIFMFENLNYNYSGSDNVNLNKDLEQTKKYYNTVKDVFKGTYLESDEYIYYFIGAGFKHNVSPVHLATRSFQEGAGDPNYAAVSGNSSLTYGGYSLKGYYNFYNIGSYVDNVTSSPVTRGLAYACGPACTFYSTYGRPWDTREKAIYGGAEKIASGYINAGQNTQYFQKFNTSPTSTHSKFTNQYQTNVTAPVSEGTDAFTSYRDMNLLEEAFIFDIPIYLNMPSVTSLPIIASTVNTLTEIKINGTPIYGFDADILEYTVYVSGNKVNIEATRLDNTSNVTGVGDIALSEELTTHKIRVTAENGLIREYILKIKRVSDNITIDEIISKLSTKQTGNIMHNISPGTLSTTLVNSVLNKAPSASVTIRNSSGGIVSNEKIKTGDTITILLSSGESRSYTISVIGDMSGDGEVTILDLLKLQKHLLGTTILKDASYVGADTNGDGNVTILDLLRVQKYILGSIQL